MISVAGLDEAEAFGDMELMAEFSLLSVVQNLQQGKIGTDLLETLEVKQDCLLHSLEIIGAFYFTSVWSPKLFCIDLFLIPEKSQISYEAALRGFSLFFFFHYLR